MMLRNLFQEVRRYPSAVVGIIIIVGLVITAIYAVIAIPYKEAVRLWRGGEDIWYKTPKTAAPAWVNWFRKDRLPETIILNTWEGEIEKTMEQVSEETREVVFSFPIEYSYAYFPNEIAVFFRSLYTEKQPYVALTWLAPDGREIRMFEGAIGRYHRYFVSQDEKLQRRLKGRPPLLGLLSDPQSETLAVLPGRYTLRVRALLFEPNADVDAEFVLYGSVYGWAGTDHRRRDLSIALLWGTPIALMFGLLAALGTTITTMIIAAFGTWFGGWLDEVIQRITEINMVLPILPILIMVGTFYSRSIWVILGVLILLSIFGGSIKTYRAVFLQVKESPYIEAARAYGASDARIIFRYLIPRIVPMLIPQLVILVPAYVFTEAALSVLGLGDPILPTWGKVIDDARVNGALVQGNYYWVLEPAALLMITGMAFSLLGFALDRIFNPRLREL